MKTLITIIIGILAWTNVGAENTDLIPHNELYSIYDLTQYCEAKGYFIYGGTIFMCTKIREGVTKEELHAFSIKDKERQEAMAKAAEERYEKFIKTERGKKWLEEYRKNNPK